MGVPPKVQPIYIGSHKTLGYTALMGVPPKVQPIYAGFQKNLGYTALKYSLFTLALQKRWVTLY